MFTKSSNEKPRPLTNEAELPAGEKKKVLGLDQVIAFYGAPQELQSPTFVLSSDWEYWRDRGGVAAVGKTWFDLLKNPVEKAVDVIVNLDYGGNPAPVVCVDEFGFDYDGQIDLKTAEVLGATKEKKTELHLTVWQMRGPVAPKLAAAYREIVDLILMETYVNPNDLWLIAAQAQAARLNGLLEKSIVGLGAGRCSRDNIDWAKTREEMEEQIRFIRLVAPESPGVGFFAVAGNMKDQPITLKDIDEICGRFQDIPTDGTGLRPELIELHKTFSKRYRKPALVCSPSWVQPNFSPGHLGPDREWIGWGELVKPCTFRVLMMNLGEEEAPDVIVRLRNPGEDGSVFAKGIVDLPAKSNAVAVLPACGQWKVWTGKWKMEVEAPGCEVLIFNLSHYGE